MATDLEDLRAIWLDLRAHVDTLAGERQHYIDFFEQSPEAYVVTGPEGTILDANGAAVDILQRRKRYLRGKPMAMLIALDQRNEFRRRLRALVCGAPPDRGLWRTIIVAAEERTEVTLATRLIERAAGVAGICWRLQAVQ